jgi:hypothetical protein
MLLPAAFHLSLSKLLKEASSESPFYKKQTEAAGTGGLCL